MTYISIHALLAESDLAGPSGPAISFNFYPRSPCGERPPLASRTKTIFTISIHALLAESDHQTNASSNERGEFLSTLSLRRATKLVNVRNSPTTKFLSTLSLRRATLQHLPYGANSCISIHALLAESDLVGDVWACRWPDISIHALLAESDK